MERIAEALGVHTSTIGEDLVNFPPGGKLKQPKTAANPNAAKLFLNWNMSDEGQAFHIKELGYLTALKNPPFNPPGYDPKVIKPWSPKFEEYVKLRNEWIEEWNKVYGYRQ